MKKRKQKLVHRKIRENLIKKNESEVVTTKLVNIHITVSQQNLSNNIFPRSLDTQGYAFVNSKSTPSVEKDDTYSIISPFTIPVFIIFIIIATYALRHSKEKIKNKFKKIKKKFPLFSAEIVPLLPTCSKALQFSDSYENVDKDITNRAELMERQIETHLEDQIKNKNNNQDNGSDLTSSLSCGKTKNPTNVPYSSYLPEETVPNKKEDSVLISVTDWIGQGSQQIGVKSLPLLFSELKRDFYGPHPCSTVTPTTDMSSTTLSTFSKITKFNEIPKDDNNIHKLVETIHNSESSPEKLGRKFACTSSNENSFEVKCYTEKMCQTSPIAVVKDSRTLPTTKTLTTLQSTSWNGHTLEEKQILDTKINTSNNFLCIPNINRNEDAIKIKKMRRLNLNKRINRIPTYEIPYKKVDHKENNKTSNTKIYKQLDSSCASETFRHALCKIMLESRNNENLKKASDTNRCHFSGITKEKSGHNALLKSPCENCRNVAKRALSVSSTDSECQHIIFLKDNPTKLSLPPYQYISQSSERSYAHREPMHRIEEQIASLDSSSTTVPISERTSSFSPESDNTMYRSMSPLNKDIKRRIFITKSPSWITKIPCNAKNTLSKKHLHGAPVVEKISSGSNETSDTWNRKNSSFQIHDDTSNELSSDNNTCTCYSHEFSRRFVKYAEQTRPLIALQDVKGVVNPADTNITSSESDYKTPPVSPSYWFKRSISPEQFKTPKVSSLQSLKKSKHHEKIRRYTCGNIDSRVKSKGTVQSKFRIFIVPNIFTCSNFTIILVISKNS